MSKYQASKTIVRSYFEAMENASPDTIADVLKEFTGEDYLWRGVYPFREQRGADAVAEIFWTPLMQSLTRMQRRQDIFIAGTNEISGEQWVMSMGNFMGLFDADWLGIPHTRKDIDAKLVVDTQQIDQHPVLADQAVFAPPEIEAALGETLD